METSYGLLFAVFNYSDAAEEEFNDWYDTEHLPQRKSTDGFINGQRWLGVENPKISVATYDLENVAVLQSPGYRGISGANLSPWSKRIAAKCQLLCRFEAEQIVPGRQMAPADAGGLLMVAMNVAPESEVEFNAWVNGEHLPRLSSVKGCVCARFFKIQDGTHRYLALHHLTSPEVQASVAWKQAAETPWTLKIRPHIRDRLQFVLRPYARKS